MIGGSSLLSEMRTAVQAAREQFRIPLGKAKDADRELDRLAALLRRNEDFDRRRAYDREKLRDKGTPPADWTDDEEQAFQLHEREHAAWEARQTVNRKRHEAERQDRAAMLKAFAARRKTGTKGPGWKDRWDREWDKRYRPHVSAAYLWDDLEDALSSFAGEAVVPKHLELGDPKQDADQADLFAGIVAYLNGFDNPDRKLHAIHNIMLKLRRIANEQHVAKDAEGES